MRIRVFATPDAASLYAATLVERVVLENPRPVLGLATGRTQIPFYNALVSLHRAGLDFSHVVSVNLDEYVGIDPNSPVSYHTNMAENFFDRVNMRAENGHLPDGAAADLEAECERYDAVLARHPRDIQILGIGRNGHIGFNEPAHTLTSHTHVVCLKPDTIETNSGLLLDPGAKVPDSAITMGVQSILQAKEVVLLAFGEDKAEVIREAVYGNVRTDLPASLLQLHQNTTFVLDEAAAAQILNEDGWICA